MKEKSKDASFSNQIYGPVPSRRLGMSLGVDVIPMKVCTYDCIYCELGNTREKTIVRREYVSEKLVTQALERYFAEMHTIHLDYVTFSGSGEPTLNSKIGALIRKVKRLTDTPVAVLTSGSLLFDPEVRQNLMQADLVVPSLDAALQDVFKKVNRPVPSLEVSDVIWGIHQFRKEFKGETWLEILFVKGINDRLGHIKKLAEATRWIEPTKIQLTTVVRPPGIGHAPPISMEKLNEISSLFEGNVEVITELERRNSPAYQEEKGDEIVAMLRIRPMTLEDISSLTGMHRNEVLKYLDHLRKDHAVHDVEFSGETYFTIDREQGISQ